MTTSIECWPIAAWLRGGVSRACRMRRFRRRQGRQQGGASWRTSVKLAALVVVAAVALSGCGEQKPPEQETFRYRLTIEVEVDGYRHKASSVLEATQTQTQTQCRFRMPGGGGGSGICLPRFYVKGVAPMIRLADGAVIFASLSGYDSYKPPGVKGRGLARLPWLLYVKDWKKTSYKPPPNVTNWPITPLPAETPRLEIPFEGHPLSKHRPAIIYGRKNQSLLPHHVPIGPRNARERTGRDIRPITFAAEPTTADLVEELRPARRWLFEARQSKKFQGARNSIESKYP